MAKYYYIKLQSIYIIIHQVILYYFSIASRSGFVRDSFGIRSGFVRDSFASRLVLDRFSIGSRSLLDRFSFIFCSSFDCYSFGNRRAIEIVHKDHLLSVAELRVGKNRKTPLPT